MALAKWLTRPDNPLATRVIVNRVWQGHFGRGLVGTPSDFGVMGQSPSHPELLDWLANEFPRLGGSWKRLHRLILTSSVYRQASRPSSGGLGRETGPNGGLDRRVSGRAIGCGFGRDVERQERRRTDSTATLVTGGESAADDVWAAVGAGLGRGGIGCSGAR